MITEMDQSVKQMLKLIEADGGYIAQNAEMEGQKSQLIAHVEEFRRMYRLLADHYYHLTESFHGTLPSELQMQSRGGSYSGSGQGSPIITPDRKLGLHSSGPQAFASDISLSSGAGSSILSLKVGAESSPSFSPESESSLFNLSVQSNFGPPMDIDGKNSELEVELPLGKEKFWMAEKYNRGSMLMAGEKDSYEGMLDRIFPSEEKLKLELSEREIARLNGGCEKTESQAQLERMQEGINTREADLKLEKGRVVELQYQIAELETHISDSTDQIRRLVEESEETRERLNSSDEEIVKLKLELAKRTSEGNHEFEDELMVAREEIATLKAELDSCRREVQESVVRYAAHVSNRDIEVRELKVALCDAQEQFSRDKAQLMSDIWSLSERQSLFDATIQEWESRGKSLEHEIRQSQAEKVELKSLHVAREMALQSEINQLKKELTEKRANVESLNQDCDILKLKYDIQMAEKDGLNATLQTLIAAVSSREDHIQQIEGHLCQLHAEDLQRTNECESALNEVHTLRLRVEELEKEVDGLRVLISDGAEEKREVIRQLCFAMEHYRGGYCELRQALIRHRHHAVMAS